MPKNNSNDKEMKYKVGKGESFLQFLLDYI